MTVDMKDKRCGVSKSCVCVACVFLTLGAVAVDGGGVDALVGQPVLQLVSASLRLHEDQSQSST